MTVKEAHEIIKNKYPDLVAIECLDCPKFYAFALANKGWNGEFLGGGYNTVNKTTGELGSLHPIHDFEAFLSAKEISISTLNR